MDKEIRADVIERTLSPLGWHLVGVSNVLAAEALITSGVKLPFEDPIRSLFAHAWELNLKACLRRQGLSAESVRTDYGHDILRLWNAIDRTRFPTLSLKDELKPFVEHLAYYHRNRLYAYPIHGRRNEHTLTYVRALSSRFLLSRADAVATFGSP